MNRSFPDMGTEPHGMMEETFYDVGTIAGHIGDLILKRNFGPEGVSVDEVLDDPVWYACGNLGGAGCDAPHQVTGLSSAGRAT